MANPAAPAPGQESWARWGQLALRRPGNLADEPRGPPPRLRPPWQTPVAVAPYQGPEARGTASRPSPRGWRGAKPPDSVVDAAAAATMDARVGLHADGGGHEGRLLTGIAEGVIQGFRHPGAKALQLGGAGGNAGEGSLHGPCSGRHFSIGPADADANRSLYRFSRKHPEEGPSGWPARWNRDESCRCWPPPEPRAILVPLRWGRPACGTAAATAISASDPSVASGKRRGCGGSGQPTSVKPGGPPFHGHQLGGHQQDPATTAPGSGSSRPRPRHPIKEVDGAPHNGWEGATFER